jgi:hypothetical protein
MSKHTPGPWEIQRDSGLHIYITQPSDTFNRVPGYYAEVRRFTTDQSQVEANAHLIAAAPDLLKVLETILECGSVNDQYWVDDARAAIAKARGE